MAKVHFDIKLIGKVQGIGLRYYIKEEADRLGIRGYARNLPDKSVAIEVEGESRLINQFVKWLESSPGLSDVKNSHISEGTVKGYREFDTY